MLSCSPADPSGPQFAAAIQQELERINAFYSEQEQQLEVVTKLASKDGPEVFAIVLNPQTKHLTILLVAGCTGRPSTQQPDFVCSVPL